MITQTEPLGGQPSPGAKPSVKDLEEQVVYQRAFEAVIWSQPAVGVYGIRRGLFALGVNDNDIMAMSRPATTRHELLTANNATPYIAANANLQSGPVVLEIPPASDKGVLYGQVVDAWQETIADVGPSGVDQGKGAKLLFLPPDYKETPPSGYIAIRSKNYRIQFAFRSIRLPGMTDVDAQTYAETLKLYSLTEANNPKPTRFVDAWPDRLSTLPFYDFRYFQDLYDALSGEPVRTRDKAIMQMLATIGIESGMPFRPPLKYKAAMERAVVDAYFYMQDRFYDVQDNNLFWSDRHYSYFFILDPQGSVVWDTPTGLFYDNRSDMYHVGTYYPGKFPKQPATAYLCAIADSDGRRLDGDKDYKLHVPKDMPVKQFWALIIYDFATWAFIYNPLDRVGFSSYDKSNMKANEDGSVDIYFGPQPPTGLESNWIPTQGKHPMPVMRFYGGTEEFWNKTFKLPDIELMR
ncbi:MAG: DUF1254 domain-containing protein [Candidatus Eremiobacteraeota bacterium]|nr:DUF1254 domain-containing protein [Candidatus Eremiobacteraeota bacterium]